MAAKGSRISRVLDYFRTTDLDELRVVSQLAGEIAGSRLAESGQAQQAKVAKPRKARGTNKKTAAKPQPITPLRPDSSPTDHHHAVADEGQASD